MSYTEVKAWLNEKYEGDKKPISVGRVINDKLNAAPRVIRTALDMLCTGEKPFFEKTPQGDYLVTSSKSSSQASRS